MLAWTWLTPGGRAGAATRARGRLWRRGWAAVAAQFVAVLTHGAATAGAPAPPTGRARPAVHAGTWYPGDARALRQALDGFLGGGAAQGEPVIAVVAPHAGVRYSGAVAGSVYATLRGQPVRRVFLLGPSHRQAFSGIALPAAELTSYATPLGDLAIDRAAIERLRGHAGFGGPASAHDAEHSLELQAVFLAAVAPRAMIVPLVVGRVEDAAAVRALAATLRPMLGEGDVVVASSDFTHYGAAYGYVPFRADVPARLAALADGATSVILRRDEGAFAAHLGRTGDTICGKDPIRVLLALLPPEARGERTGFDTSGRLTGSFESSVSYLGFAFRRSSSWAAAGGGAEPQVPARPLPAVLGPEQQQAALRLARRTLELVLAGAASPDAAGLGVPADPVWQRPHATFVTLKRRGELRGCIGHIEAVGPLWQDIRDNAVAAALSDPRFPRVKAAELAGLELEVSVLTPLAPASSAAAVVVGRHGVVLSVGGRRAVFLPQVAVEQGWDRETMLRHLAVKAGLSADAWRAPEARFQVFEAQVFGEHGAPPSGR